MPGDKDFDAVGIPSTSIINDILDNAEDPRQAISEFQEQNSLLLPSLKPVLKLLELHGVRRKEYHELVLSKLSDRLLDKIRALGSSKNPEDIRKLEAQLERSFKLYQVSKIRPIVLETLSILPKVPSKFLKKIVEDPQLYGDCSVSIKQQIWLTKGELFIRAIDPVLDSYIDDKEKILTSPSANFFTCNSAKSRRQWGQIKELLTMIGNQEKLYQKLIEILRERFVEHESPHYCSIRLELLMAIHDANVDYAVQIDKTHDLSWCLDACVRDQHLDIQQMTKLKALLDKKKLTDENIGDISFVLNDPHTVHFLCTTVIKILDESAKKCSGLPREDGVLSILLRMLYVEEVLEEFSLEFQPLNSNLTQFIKSDVVCGLIWFHYVLKLLNEKSRVYSREMFEHYLKVCCKSKNKILMKEPWASMLTHCLIQSSFIEQNISDSHFSRIVFHDFYSRGINHNANNRFHILHLCFVMMQHISSEELTENVLKAADLNQKGGGTASFVGRSSAKRFEKELQQFASIIQGKNAEEATSENNPAGVSAETSDLLSTVEFD